MAGETGETPSEVVAQQTQPIKESFVTRFKNKLLGRSSQHQAPETMQPTAGESNQPAGVTPREAVRKLETGQATEMFKPYGAEITPPSDQVQETAPGWLKQQQQERLAATGPKTPEQIAEEVRIDAENLAKLQQPTQAPGKFPRVAPFVEPPTTSPTTLPEKVFEPQPEVSGEHEEVDEFLKTKPQPSVETPVTTSPGEAIPVQSSPEEEQPIPVNIPQRTPVNVGDEVR